MGQTYLPVLLELLALFHQAGQLASKIFTVRQRQSHLKPYLRRRVLILGWRLRVQLRFLLLLLALADRVEPAMVLAVVAAGFGTITICR